MDLYQETTCVEELLIQYKETLKRTKESIDELKSELAPYKAIYDDKQMPPSLRADAKSASAVLQHDLSIYNSIRNELEYTIHWMKTGHSPENKRGIERRAAYQNERPIDPLLMQRYFRSNQPLFSWDNEPKEYVVTPTEKLVIDQALAALTERELEVFLMNKGKGFTQYKIADLMKISRSSVQTMINRANKKIAVILKKQKEGESA